MIPEPVKASESDRIAEQAEASPAEENGAVDIGEWMVAAVWAAAANLVTAVGAVFEYQFAAASKPPLPWSSHAEAAPTQQERAEGAGWK